MTFASYRCHNAPVNMPGLPVVIDGQLLGIADFGGTMRSRGERCPPC
jgi:hypothetical protein